MVHHYTKNMSKTTNQTVLKRGWDATLWKNVPSQLFRNPWQASNLKLVHFVNKIITFSFFIESLKMYRASPKVQMTVRMWEPIHNTIKDIFSGTVTYLWHLSLKLGSAWTHAGWGRGSIDLQDESLHHLVGLSHYNVCNCWADEPRIMSEWRLEKTPARILSGGWFPGKEHIL